MSIVKKIIVISLMSVLITGCHTQDSNKSAKYALLYSNDKTESFDSSSFVMFDANGEIAKEESFDGTLFTQFTQYDDKLITNNGQEIVEYSDDKINSSKYKKQLNAYSSELNSFEYKNQLYWFVHGGNGEVYNSYLY